MAILRTIAIILLVYYVIKIVSRLMLPIVAKKFMQKMEDKMRNAQGGFNQEQSKQVGETTIDKTTKQKPNNKVEGEYVDFEEID